MSSNPLKKDCRTELILFSQERAKHWLLDYLTKFLLKTN